MLSLQCPQNIESGFLARSVGYRVLESRNMALTCLPEIVKLERLCELLRRISNTSSDVAPSYNAEKALPSPAEQRSRRKFFSFVLCTRTEGIPSIFQLHWA